MTDTEFREPQGSSFAEHLIFVALLLPTFLVIAAAIVSLAPPEASIAIESPILTAAACDACPPHGGNEGP